jgi:putative lipoprotein
MRMTRIALWGIGLCVMLACGSGKSAGGAAASAEGAALGANEWALVALGDKTDPLGNGGRPITLRFDLADARASGFGGCNQYSGSVEVKGAELKFGPIASTKMACEQGMDVEDAYLSSLGTVQSWEIADSVLVLKVAGIAVLRFKPVAP